MIRRRRASAWPRTRAEEKVLEFFQVLAVSGPRFGSMLIDSFGGSAYALGAGVLVEKERSGSGTGN